MIGETVRERIADHHPAAIPRAVLCVCGSGGGGDGGGRNRDRPVRGGDQCLYLREPGAPPSSPNEHAAHPRCAVATTPLCEQRSPHRASATCDAQQRARGARQ